MENLTLSTLAGVALLASAPACPSPDSEAEFLVLALADESADEAKLGAVVIVQARGGGAVTLSATGGTLVHPLTGALGSQLCLAVDVGAYAIELIPDPEFEAARVRAHLWADEPAQSEDGLGCEDVARLIASGSLVIGAAGEASPEPQETSGPDMGETETGA